MYHVTRIKFIQSILLQGLDPQRGGGGGFAELGTRNLGGQWKKQSEGKVHTGLERETAGRYMLTASLPPPNQGLAIPSFGDRPITLVFEVDFDEEIDYEKDPDDLYAVTTRNRIPPERIRVLVHNGDGEVEMPLREFAAQLDGASLGQRREQDIGGYRRVVVPPGPEYKGLTDEAHFLSKTVGRQRRRSLPFNSMRSSGLPSPGVYNSRDLAPGDLLAMVDTALKRHTVWAVRLVETARGDQATILEILFSQNARFEVTEDGHVIARLRGG